MRFWATLASFRLASICAREAFRGRQRVRQIERFLEARPRLGRGVARAAASPARIA
jgi:hypothetical protein